MAPRLAVAVDGAFNKSQKKTSKLYLEERNKITFLTILTCPDARQLFAKQLRVRARCDHVAATAVIGDILWSLR